MRQANNNKNRKRRLNPDDATLNDLDMQSQKMVVEDMRTKWQSAVDKCDNRTGISHSWRLAKSQSGKIPHNSTNKGVRFAEKSYLDPKKIANKFAHQCTPPPIRLAGHMSIKQLNRHSFIPSDAITKNAINTKSDPIGHIVQGHRTR